MGETAELRDADNPLTWEGRYRALRVAYDKNRAELARLEDRWNDLAEVAQRLGELRNR